MVALEALFPGSTADWRGSLSSAGAGLTVATWALCVSWRESSWAVIPVGAVLSLGLAAGIDTALSGTGAGAGFFLGMVLAVGVLYLLFTLDGCETPALYPAAVLLAHAALVLAGTGHPHYATSSALILVGLYAGHRMAGLSRPKARGRASGWSERGR